MAKIEISPTKADYKKLHFTRGDCLVVRRPKGMDDYDWAQQLRLLGEDVANTIPFPVLVFGIDKSWKEIERVSEEQMEHYGWVRKDRVFAFKDEAHDLVAQKFEELSREYHASVTSEEEE